MAWIDEERKMTKLRRAGEAIIINHSFRSEESTSPKQEPISAHYRGINHKLCPYAHTQTLKTCNGCLNFPKDERHLNSFIRFLLYLSLKLNFKAAAIDILMWTLGQTTMCNVKGVAGENYHLLLLCSSPQLEHFSIFHYVLLDSGFSFQTQLVLSSASFQIHYSPVYVKLTD